MFEATIAKQLFLERVDTFMVSQFHPVMALALIESHAMMEICQTHVKIPGLMQNMNIYIYTHMSYVLVYNCIYIYTYTHMCLYIYIYDMYTEVII